MKFSKKSYTITCAAIISFFLFIAIYFRLTPLNYHLSFFTLTFFIVLIVCSYVGKVCIYDCNHFPDDYNSNSQQTDLKRVIGLVIKLSLCLICFLTINWLVSSKMLRYNDYRSLAGQINGKDFSKEVKHIDLDNLPIIDSALARNLADKKLGQITALGSQVEIGDVTLQQIAGKLYYVAPLEHSGFWKWLDNKGGTPGYVKVSATNPDDIQLVTELNGKPLKLKYLDSAFFGENIKRYAYFNAMTKGLTDFSFELDDEGNPYWAITMYENTIGFSGSKVTGIMLVNAQTGKIETYNTENAPRWVDRIQPVNFVVKNLDNWGKLIHGIFNYSNEDEIITTEGVKIIYNDNKCYYYTGVSSVGKDESLVGFTLTDTRTGETTLYKTSGATETAGMKSAEGKVQQYGYSATFPMLVNIQGEPTYFTTLKDKKGLIKMYAMVNVKNYNIVGIGENLQSTLNNYIENLAANNTSLSSTQKEEVLEGTIERIGLVIKQGTSIYDLKIKGSDYIFSVSTEVTRNIAITQKDDKVKVIYIKTGDSKNIIVKEFQNLNTK